MRMCVTGGGGFIGSQIAEALAARGDDVVVVDDFSTGKREYVPPTAHLVESDLATSTCLAEALRGVDVVFHTAALARVPRSIEQPLETHAANVTGTLNLLKACVDAGVRRVVYSSSSSVYGDQPTLPLTEDMIPNPLNPYACQKYMGEIYCRNFFKVYGLQSVCLRYFNVYGPRQAMEGAYRLVIGIFLDQRERDLPLTIHGDGQQTRDFTHVSDVVRANLLAATAPALGAGEPVNVGSGRELSVNQLAALIGGPTVHAPARGNDERFKRASVARAREVLGWEPTVTLEEGIARLLRDAAAAGAAPAV
jgi:nucleoside-diphosphate-sugar epimerase